MATWTDELKAKAVEEYLKRNPTPENTIEMCKEVAELIGQSPNGVRMILMQADKYVKTAPAGGDSETGKAASTKKTSGEGTKRVSKESQIAELKAAIENAGGEVDDDILSKLTGKAAAYFTAVLTKK